MLDFGFSELSLCFLVALIVLGPEKLPPLARKLGRMTGSAKSYMRQITQEIERETYAQQLREQMDNVKRTVEKEAEDFRRNARDLSHEAQGKAPEINVPEVGAQQPTLPAEPPAAPPSGH